MNFLKIFPFALLSLALSCESAKLDTETGGAASALKGTDTPYTQEQIDQAIYVQGSAIVQFSPEMAEAIERGANPFGTISSSVTVNHYERLFPEAGEYEARTREAGLHTFYIVEFDEKVSLSTACKAIQTIPGVENFEKRNIRKIARTNDPYWTYQWEYTGNYDIHLEDARKYTVGDPKVKVCVVDEGIQLNHEDLAWNCGDTHYNFVDGNTSIVGGDHGTHVAGSIAAVGNNEKGLVGIAGGDYSRSAKGVTLMSAQVFKGNRAASGSGFERAIKWGADNGAVISQNSWGNNYDWNGDGQLTGSELQYALNDKISASTAAAVDYFIKNAGCDANGKQRADSPMKGGVVCFAAGNDGIVNGVPANYDPIISVGATAKSGSLASYSNYGPWVKICAPGSSIYSTVPTSRYASMSGTSMACPHVSGACALLVSYFGKQGFTNEMLKDILLNGARKNLINCGQRSMGPYLDLKGSLLYGIEKYGEGNENGSDDQGSGSSDPGNAAPEIEAPSISNTISLRYGTNAGIFKRNFRVSDADNDEVKVSWTIEGPATIAQSEISGEYHFMVDFSKVQEAHLDNTYPVRITAEDSKHATALLSFNYIIKSNKAPIVTTSYTGDFKFRQWESPAITFTITDEDRDDFTSSMETDGPAKWDSAKRLFTLDCKAVKDFTPKNARIVAVDSYGGEGSMSFQYQVVETKAPVAAEQIPPLVLAGTTTEGTMAMNKIFTDPNGDPLQFTTKVANSKMATARIKDGYLNVKMSAVGSTEVTVTAVKEDVPAEFNPPVSVTLKLVCRDPQYDFDYYPNPMVDVLYIRPAGKSNTKFDFSISAADGSKVRHAQGVSANLNNPYAVDVADLAPGRYELYVAMGGKEYRNVVVKRP